MELKEIPLKDIVISKTNPRKTFDEASIEELAQSIFEKGVLQPIVVRKNGAPGKYEIVCGERRYRASIKAQVLNKNLTTIPAVIRELTNEEALELQIIENLQRKDVHPMEEAVAFKGLIDLKKFDVHEIAKRIGKGATYVAQRLKLNDLIEQFQKAFYQDRMNLTDAMKLCKLAAADQKEIWKEDGEGEGKISVDDWMLRKFMGDLNNAPFDINDKDLKKDMGACTGCQFNSASNSLLFPDAARKATCLNSTCYQQKANLSYSVELKKATEDPAVVLISGSYGSLDKDARALVNKGMEVYSRSHYNTERKPEVPDLSEFEEDLGDGVYDTQEEMMKEYNAKVKQYDKDLVEYNKKIASGKFLRGFHVEGDGKGTYDIVTLRKDSKPAKTLAGAKAKAETEGVSAEDIKGEMQRVRDREKRNKELDMEKIHYATRDVFNKNKSFKENKEDLSFEEMCGAILVMFENHAARSAGEKFFKTSSSYSSNNLAVLKKLQAAKFNELTQALNLMFRAAIMDKLAPINSASNQRPDANGHASAFALIAKQYVPKQIEEIEKNQLEERSKRETKVAGRLNGLQKKLAEIKKPAKKKEAAAPATKQPKASKPSKFKFMEPLMPSEALAVIVGKEPIVRTEVTKKVWEYVKKHKLQDQKERRNINCDEVFQKICNGKKVVSMFDMAKHLNNSLTSIPKPAKAK